MTELLAFLNENRSFFTTLVIEHVMMTFLASSLATVFGIVIGVAISKRPRLASLVISLVNVLYTIPSIALLGFLISVTGIGNTTAIIALSLYALLPMVRSTYVGITGIDKKLIEASEAMGSTRWQVLVNVQLPLAFPVIYGAIRNMVTMTIALAGIASFVGAGGLGVAIYRGITTNNQSLLLLGSGLIAVLALFTDGILGVIEKTQSKTTFKMGRFVLYAMLTIFALCFFFQKMPQKENTLHIASKPTTESYILSEMLRQVIEDRTDYHVKVTHGVGGGTANIHPAIVKGSFDLYPEYTGTGWQIVLKEEAAYSESLFPELVSQYENDYHLTWKGMFGFNNTYGLGVRKDLAEQYQLETFSDLAKFSSQLTFGAEYDFFEREDGFNGLTKAYDMTFKTVVDMDNGLKYQALLDGQIDVMTVFTTDGQLANPDIVVLKDDLAFYPSYRAGVVVREGVVDMSPELEEAIDLFKDRLDEKTMAQLNYQVEVTKESPAKVAKDFLTQRGLLKGK